MLSCVGCFAIANMLHILVSRSPNLLCKVALSMVRSPGEKEKLGLAMRYYTILSCTIQYYTLLYDIMLYYGLDWTGPDRT